MYCRVSPFDALTRDSTGPIGMIVVEGNDIALGMDQDHALKHYFPSHSIILDHTTSGDSGSQVNE